MKENRWRSHFPLFKQKEDLIYFDSAATTQKPKSVIDTLTDFYSFQYATVHRAVYDLSKKATERYELVREKVRAFLSAASRDEIVFTRGTTAAINLLAHSLGKSIKKGDAVLISAIEHHSNIVPWQMMCEEKGAELRIIPVNEKGEIIWSEYENLLDERVKIVSVAHVSNAFGTLHPIEEMIKAAHRIGALFIVDGAQGAAHLPIDVKKMDCDFYLFSGHKAYGPTGVGILYGKMELLAQLPPLEGGGDMIEKVTFEKTTFAKPPFRFEGGTPMIAEVIGLGAAIDFLTAIGMESIEFYEKELLTYATAELQQIPEVTIIGTANNKGAIISFIIDGAHPLDVGTLLNCRNIALRTGHHCAQPAMELFQIPGTSRISFGLYNTPTEIDRFITELKQVIQILK